MLHPITLSSSNEFVCPSSKIRLKFGSQLNNYFPEILKREKLNSYFIKNVFESIFKNPNELINKKVKNYRLIKAGELYFLRISISQKAPELIKVKAFDIVSFPFMKAIFKGSPSTKEAFAKDLCTFSLLEVEENEIEQPVENKKQISNEEENLEVTLAPASELATPISQLPSHFSKRISFDSVEFSISQELMLGIKGLRDWHHKVNYDVICQCMQAVADDFSEIDQSTAQEFDSYFKVISPDSTRILNIPIYSYPPSKDTLAAKKVFCLITAYYMNVPSVMRRISEDKSKYKQWEQTLPKIFIGYDYLF